VHDNQFIIEWTQAHARITPAQEPADLSEIIYIALQEFGKFIKKIFGGKFDISAKDFSFLNKSFTVFSVILLVLIAAFILFLFRKRIMRLFRLSKAASKPDFDTEFQQNISVQNFTAALRLLIQYVAEYTGKTASTFTELFHIKKESQNSDLADHYGRVIHLHLEADKTAVRRTYHHSSEIIPEFKKKKSFDAL
jgi:hypothetical protein